MVYFADERGQGLAEYAFLLLLVTLVVLGLLTIFGTQVNAMYSTVHSAWPPF